MAFRENKFPDNLSTHAMVSGIWRASVALGSAIGKLTLLIVIIVLTAFLYRDHC